MRKEIVRMANPQDNGSQANVDKGTRVDMHLGRQKSLKNKNSKLQQTQFD